MALREAHKADKRRRIFEAARQQFATLGFEAATIRGIAAAADVGVGTVLLYGDSKQALLQEVWRDAVMPAVEEACVAAQGQPLVPGAMVIFGRLLREYAAHPAMARVVVKELPWLEGRAAAAHVGDLLALLGALVGLVAAESARLGWRDVDPLATAELFFSVYYASCLRLLTPAGEPDVEAVIGALQAHLTTIHRGLESTS